MKGKFFIDTNIFVYSFDKTAPKKAEKSISIIEHALKSGNGCISTQVIQEFTNVAIKKFQKPLSFDDCKLYLKTVLFPLCEIQPDPDFFEMGLNIKQATGYSFYDSLIIAAAQKGECRILYTEDMQNGQNVGGVVITNPFVED